MYYFLIKKIEEINKKASFFEEEYKLGYSDNATLHYLDGYREALEDTLKEYARLTAVKSL